MEDELIGIAEYHNRQVDTLYYQHLFDYDTLVVYEFRDSVLKIVCEIQVPENYYADTEIQYWLDNNGFEKIEFNFEPLIE